MQRFGFDSRFYQIFEEVVGLERGPLGILSTIEELLGRNSRGSRLKIRKYSPELLPFYPNIYRSNRSFK
jgi:hypothetical protein